MSIIKCPECGHEVSSKAPMCLHCGVTIANNVKRCPVCNRFLLMDVTECPDCHTHFLNPAKTEEEVVPEEPTPGKSLPNESQEATTEQMPTPRKPRKGGSWFVIFLIIVGAAIACFIYWNVTEKKDAEAEQAYRLLLECNDPQNFDDFIARFPKSVYVEDVRARRKELEVEQSAWEEVKQSNSVAAIEKFLHDFPDTRRKHAALQRIDSLDWQDASRRGTSEAYTCYIKRHENGEFLTEAYSARNEAALREAEARKDSLAAFADSLSHASAVVAPL